jgi:putative tricarboxylic transport membrane protein
VALQLTQVATLNWILRKPDFFESKYAMSEQTATTTSTSSPTQIGIALLGLALSFLMMWGATGISSEAGYAGVGPNFLPWVVAIFLATCSAWLLWESLTGGYRNMPEASGAERADWHAFAWVSAGVLANAALINAAGFVLSCALCFVLAVRGLRLSQGDAAGNLSQTLKDCVLGFLIAAPVFWLFTLFLSINLPNLTGTPWL